MSEKKETPKQEPAKIDVSKKEAPPKDPKMKLKIIGFCILGTLLALGAVLNKPAIFGMDGLFGFYAWFGFLACVGFVVVAHMILRPLLKRKDSYYD